MNKWQQQVREFQKAIGQTFGPATPMLRNPVLRARLIVEEAIETVFALVGDRAGYSLVQDVLRSVVEKRAQDKATGEPNMIEAIDGVIDTIVVCAGTGEDIGVDLDPFFDAVMDANMKKVNGPIDSNGKRLKPPGWTPPDLDAVLARVAGGAR